MREQTNKILKTLCIYMLVISMMLSSLVGSWDVMAAGQKLKEPKINPVSPGATEISGSGAGRIVVDGSYVYATVHVILKDKNDVKKAEGSFTRMGSSSKWTVTLTTATEAGDKVIAYNQIGKQKSPEAKVKVEELLADQYKEKLKMSTLEVWSEDLNTIEADAVEDIVNAFKAKNKTLANISGKNFEGNLYVNKGDYDQKQPLVVAGDGTSITINFKDGSQIKDFNISDKVTVKQITEVSNSPEIDKLTVVDGKITGKISGGEENKKDQFKRARITIVKFTNGKPTGFCTDQGCSYDKNSAKEIATVDVNPDTGKFEYTIQDTPVFQTLEYGKDIGVVVKEYRKKNNCSTKTPEYVIPNVGVRDPKNLTEKEKDEIRQAIRKANTREDGVSKLPDWTVYNVPAIIDFDKDGNVKIINPSKVQGDWNEDYTKFVPKKNDDGSIKLNVGEKPEKTIEPKEVLENLPPNQPTVSYKKETGEITVTPDKEDTDAKTITVKYKDPDGNDKEVIVTKEDGENGKWKAPEGSKVTVNPDTGVVTIKDSDIQNKTNVSATVTDEGGIAANDTDKKTSDNKSEQIKIYPKKPEITVNETDGSVTITPVDKDNDKVAKKMDIIYTPVGSDTTKTVTAERDNDGKWSVPGESDFKVSDDGKSITITNDKIKSKTDITAKTNDGDANDKLESDPDTKQVPDKTAPKPPTVEVDTTDGTAHITPPTDPDVKTIEVKYPGADGNEKKFTATKTDTGWEISGDSGVTFEMSGYISIPYDKLKKADTITAIAKDKDGNESKPGTDISLPPAPTAKESEGVITVTPPENTPAVNGMEITYTPGGEDTEKTITVVKGNDNNWKITGNPVDGISVDGSTGQVTIAEGVAKETSEVKAKSKIDTDKRSLDEGKVQVPESKAPEAPTVKVQEDDSVTITPKDKGETTVTVTYKDKDGNDKTATATKGKNGKWTVVGTNGEEINEDSGVITIPAGKTNPGDKVKATATKGSKTSEEGKDLTKPAPPTVTPDQESGNVTITPPSKGNVDGMIIKYKKPDDSEGTIKVKKGESGTWTFDRDNPDAEGLEVNGQSGVVTIKKGHAKEKTPVTADSTIENLQTPDKNQGEQPALVPDKTAPQPPKVALDETSGNITITPPNDEDTTKVTVTYKKADGSQVKVVAKKANNTWTLTGEDGSAVTNEETVEQATGIITLLKGKYQTGEEVKAYGNDNVDNKSINDSKTPVEVTFNGNNGAGSMEGKILIKGGEYTLPENKFTPPANKEFEGWQVGRERKKAGETINVNVDTTIMAVWKDIQVDITFDKGEGSGNKDKVSVAKGSEYTLPNSDGFTAPENKKFVGWEVNGETKNVGDKITVTDNTTVTAKYEPIMVDVSFDKGEGSGEKAKVSVAKGSEYTLPNSDGFTAPENKKFVGWEVNGETKNVGDKITVTDNTTVTAKYAPIMVDVSFDKGEGSGKKAKVSVAKGSEYTLPNSDGFTAPENKKFVGWEVNGETKNVGDKIKVTDNTTVTAKYAPIMVDVSFDKDEGSGEKAKVSVAKGSEYTLPDSEGFTAPEGKKFDGWMVGTEKKAVGDKITVNANTEVKAVWVNDPNPEPQPDPTPNPQDPEQNIKAPTVSVDLRTGNLIITPPVLADIKSLTVNYKDPTGVQKTVVAEKSADGWSLVPAATNGENVNKDNGAITIPKGNYKLGEIVTAFANNNINEKSTESNATPLEVSFDVNGGSKGVESSIALKNQYYVLPAIYERPEYMLTMPEGKEFDGWEVDGVKHAPRTRIEITKNTVLKAIWKDKGQDSNPQPNQPVPQVDSYNPWWPIWFGSSEVKPATPVAPVKPAVEMERGIHHKYLYGYKDHTVRPEGLITRAEAAALIARLAELDMSNNMKPNFKDTKSAWYNTAINAVVAKNLMFADKDGDFRPNEPITRGEFARALFFIDKKNNAVAPFADVKGHVYEEAINQAYGNDRIKGYPDGTFKPDATITRAEAATILNNYADRNVTFKGMVEVHKDVVKFTDINESHWAYYEIMEAANTHEYQREKGTIPETWLEIKDK